MAQYTTLLTERRFPLVDRSYFLPQDRSLASGSHWPSTYPAPDATAAHPSPLVYWPAQQHLHHHQTSYSPEQHPAAAVSDPRLAGFTVQSEYPESSQRTILPTSPPTPLSNALPLPSYTYKCDLPRSPSHSPEFNSPKTWRTEDLYSIEDCQTQSSSRHPSSAPSLAADLDADEDTNDDPEGCFIMELSSLQTQTCTMLSQSLAPPTEVPLRATQATKEMRKLMGVFRLNPFAMHNGEGRGVLSSPWCGGEARPLDEEPLIFEFQLDLDDAVLPDSEEEEGTQLLRAFSPDFELHREQDEGDRSDWGEYRSEGTSYRSEYKSDGTSYAPAPPTWEMESSASAYNNNQPGGEEHFSSPESDFGHSRTAHGNGRIHNTLTHPYLRRPSYQHPQSSSQYAGSTSFLGSTSSLEVHRLRDPYDTASSTASLSGSTSNNNHNHNTTSSLSAATWGTQNQRSAYTTRSTGSVYAPDSPECSDPTSLPSITSNRRWSLPDSSNLGTSGPFLM
ncbi:hypothetical protein BDQ12DRAFT_135743 [Crucibulum laeve]|uniref:Uncharacterized protein n=1 Tax=Crucibulum laeve TaxID=68775 RepID=A0A5C3MA87_9AGAR|nr:hypothetical protein BDQ12DRAFT_135743 [Crucibulum laeve]